MFKILYSCCQEDLKIILLHVTVGFTFIGKNVATHICQNFFFLNTHRHTHRSSRVGWGGDQRKISNKAPGKIVKMKNYEMKK